jgi:hypothetical protein
LKAKPAGSVPETRLREGAGSPEATTVKDPAVPAVKETAAALVNAGGWRTFKVPAADGAVPDALVAMALNWCPSIAAVTALTVRTLVATPPTPGSVESKGIHSGLTVPLVFRCHWMTGAGSPEAVTEKVAVELTGALKFPEKPVIDGPVWADAGDANASHAARANCNRSMTARDDTRPDGFFSILMVN